MAKLFPLNTTKLMKQLVVFFGCILLFSACKQSREDTISKKWQAAKVENPDLEKQIAASKVFFDTVGRNTNADANEQLYGVRNMDSMRQVLNEQLDSFVAMQEHTVQNTWMDFKKDSVLIADFGNGADTVTWYFNEDGDLMIDEMAAKGTGDVIKMQVLQLEDTLLKVKFTENGFSSTASFHPADK
jgi:hypothetical protein